MPVPLEPTCYRNLFTMTAVMGGIVNEARSHDRWDKTLLGFFGSYLVGLVDECDMAEACSQEAYDLAGVLGELISEPDTPDPQKVEEQVNNMGQHMADLTTCMFDMYALSPDFTAFESRTLPDWPDEPWMLEVRPRRVRTVR